MLYGATNQKINRNQSQPCNRHLHSHNDLRLPDIDPDHKSWAQTHHAAKEEPWTTPDETWSEMTRSVRWLGLHKYIIIFCSRESDNLDVWLWHALIPVHCLEPGSTSTSIEIALKGIGVDSNWRVQTIQRVRKQWHQMMYGSIRSYWKEMSQTTNMCVRYNCEFCSAKGTQFL